MKHLIPAAALLACLSAAPATAGDCDEAGLKTIGEVQEALRQKAVEIVNLARAPGGDSARLQALITPGATFSLGAGDVGVPMGTGLTGARAFSAAMPTDSFRYYTWSGIPTPAADPCGAQQVQVEFIASAAGTAYPVTFLFAAGRLTHAGGWTSHFASGTLNPNRN